jgi:hypothetical protein
MNITQNVLSHYRQSSWYALNKVHKFQQYIGYIFSSPIIYLDTILCLYILQY